MKIDSYYRQATPAEIADYHDILYPLQDVVFVIPPYSIPVLQQRLQTLPLSDQRALAQRLQSAKHA